MRNNFISGLLSGLFGAILLFSIIGTVYIIVNDNTTDMDSGSQIEARDEQSAEIEKPEKTDQQFGQIVDKLTFLEMLVDNYYLEEVDPEVFADGIYKGFISSLEDPYSTYYTKEEYSSLVESSSGVYCGIGANVSQDVKTGIITIVTPFITGPAYEVGILPGDILYTVNGEKITGVDLTEVVSRMKGLEGTSVQISILREDEMEPIEYEIIRREIEVPTIEYKILEEQIGYIIISEFDQITVSQFSDAISELEKAGIKGIVIDVRNNPGGLLSSVVKMLDRLFPSGLIVYTEDKYGKRVEENAVDSLEIDLPMAVLINGHSASASEIFAGAIQDYEIGTIVGTTSYGKGIVQKVIPLTDGTAVKLTISKYYTPKGRNIHGTGIVPDVEVELPDELKKQIIIPNEEDTQLQEALKIVKDRIK